LFCGVSGLGLYIYVDMDMGAMKRVNRWMLGLYVAASDEME